MRSNAVSSSQIVGGASWLYSIMEYMRAKKLPMVSLSAEMVPTLPM